MTPALLALVAVEFVDRQRVRALRRRELLSCPSVKPKLVIIAKRFRDGEEYSQILDTHFTRP